jgi:signal transduction histidine kinase
MASGQRAEADIIRMLGEEMNERIQYQLKLSRLRIRSQSQGVQSSINDAVLRSVSVLRKTPQGEHLNWRVDLGESIEVDVDEHDLMEMIGVLLENACKWAMTRVDVVATKGGDMAKLRVDDDGGGLTDAQIASLGERGRRLDQSRPGEGLGLAIVFEIVRLNNGRLDLARSPLGGLQVELQLPLAGLRDAEEPPKLKAG